LLERHRGAAHVAARREVLAAETEDLDRGRALGDFERLDRRQVRADPGDRRGPGDHRPEAEHHAPIDKASDHRPALVAAVVAAASLLAALALLLAWLGIGGLGAARTRLVVVFVFVIVVALARFDLAAATRARFIFPGPLATGAGLIVLGLVFFP